MSGDMSGGMRGGEGRGVIGIIGGSGLYQLLDGARDAVVDTPYGPPSSPVSRGVIDSREVAFITRHGRNHDIAPHAINYRANLWALRSLGCDTVLTSSAVGSLRSTFAPGDFVLCDQFVDRTRGRVDTFFDGPRVVHVSMADPYCPALRAAAQQVLSAAAETFHPTGTAVVIQGPRFSTRAESAWFRQMGADVLSMTQHPETTLARELEMCCVNLSFVTDYDGGVEGTDEAAVTGGAVWRRLAEHADRIRRTIGAIVAAIPDERGCGCRSALADT